MVSTSAFCFVLFCFRILFSFFFFVWKFRCVSCCLISPIFFRCTCDWLPVYNSVNNSPIQACFALEPLEVVYYFFLFRLTMMFGILISKHNAFMRWWSIMNNERTSRQFQLTVRSNASVGVPSRVPRGAQYKQGLLEEAFVVP